LANQGKLADALVWSERWIGADRIDPAAHYLHALVLQEAASAQPRAVRWIGRSTFGPTSRWRISHSATLLAPTRATRRRTNISRTRCACCAVFHRISGYPNLETLPPGGCGNHCHPARPAALTFLLTEGTVE